MKTKFCALIVSLGIASAAVRAEETPKPAPKPDAPSSFESLFNETVNQLKERKAESAAPPKETAAEKAPAPSGQDSVVPNFLKHLSGTSLSGQSLGSTILSNAEVRKGLQEALTKGVKSAINTLGKTDGFLKDANVKIPLPDPLSRAEQPMRLLGQEKLVDDFITRMNRAAEQAVPLVVEVFTDAILQMSIDDAMTILNGEKRAATRYFRKTAGAQLEEKIHPTVAKVTSENGVTATYKTYMNKASVVTDALGKGDFDIDRYVTRKAVDGLFFMIGKEEELIRKNPAARTTDLLQRVFGAAVAPKSETKTKKSEK